MFFSCPTSFRLKNEPIDFVACSTLKRARQTTECILNEMPHIKNVEYHKDLEELGYGALEGLIVNV